MAGTLTPAQMLAAFNGSAVPRSIPVGSAPYGDGAVTFNLPKAGVPTYGILSFDGSLARTEGTTVGTVTANQGWPFSVLGVSTLVDPGGLTRLSVDGVDLYQLELVKAFGAYQRDNYAAEPYADSIYQAAIPAGTASSTTSGDVNFSLIVPISYTKMSALGSYAATVPNGQATFNIVEQPLTGATQASPLTVSGGSTVKLTGTWSLAYNYLDAASSVPVPVAALTQVHELYHQSSDENLQAGGTAIVDLLTGRQYMRVIQRLFDGNSPTLANVTKLQFLVDSSTPTLNDTLTAYRMRIRTLYGRDFPDGMVYWDFTHHPWMPNNYGSLSAQLTLGSGYSTSTYKNLITLREALYVPSGNVQTIGAGG